MENKNIKDLQQVREALESCQWIDRWENGGMHQVFSDKKVEQALAYLDAYEANTRTPIVITEEMVESAAEAMWDARSTSAVRWKEMIKLSKVDGYLNAKEYVKTAKKQAKAALEAALKGV